MANKIAGLTIAIDGETTGLSKALSGVNKHSKDLAAELKNVERLLKLDPKNTELVAQKQKLLAESVANTKTKLDTLKEAEKQAQAQFAQGKIGEDQYRAIQREVIKTEQDLKKLEKQLIDVNDGWKDTAESLDKFGKKSVETGKSMTTKVTLPILAAGVAATKMGSDFADAMAKVDTIADTTQVPLEELRKGILELSDQTGISAVEIANNVYDAISAGQDTANAVDFVASSTKLAKVGFAEAGQSLDILTTIMNAYGLEADEVDKVSDMLIQTQNKGKVTVGELSTSMGKLIPTAKSVGVGLDQVGAAYAILTSNGIKAAEATTFTNSMLNELGKTGSKSDKELRKLTGQSFKELIESGSSVTDVLAMLNDSASQSGLSLADMFGSAEASKAALVLLGEGTSTFNDMVKEMNNSLGATEIAFEKLQTPGEQARISWNKLKNIAIELGDILLPIVVSIAEVVGNLAEKFAGLDESTKVVILTILGLVAVIGPLLIIAGKIAFAISSLITLFGAGGAAAGVLGTAFTILSGPIGLAIAAIAAIIAIGVLLYKNWDEIKETAQQLGAYLKGKFEEIKSSITEPILAAIDIIKNIDLFEVGKNIITGFIDGIKSMIGKVKNTISNVASTVTNGIKGALEISSPSKVMMEMGQQTGEGFALGIERSLSQIASKSLAMADASKVGVQSTNTINNVDKGTTQTVNIYSPTALSPSETARQVKNASRELAMGV